MSFQPKGKYSKGEVKEDINYAKILFWQIERILKAITEHNENAIIGVDALEIVLTHHHDDEFFKELTEINEWYTVNLNKASVMGRISGDDSLRIEFLKAKKKFRALMKLINRVGLFPRERATYEGE